MKHLGDITKISGYDAPIVDCIIGGSPCQDLSVAGKRAGLDGERSGLYIEQVRIVKEMRKRDERNGRTGVDVRPRYMVWENVPGAFSSNKGEDFRIVLEEIAKVCDKDAIIPMPDKGKWTNHGCILGDGWSVAWRVLDAQFWGVPQRRRRIALVADFGGQSAPEILFVRQSVSGHTDESLPKRKGASSDAEGSLGADDSEGEIPYTLKIRSGCEGGGKGALIQKDKSATLSTLQDQTLFQPVYSVENHPNDSRVGINEDGKVQALTSRMGTGGGNVPMVMQQCYSKQKRAQSATDNETWVESDTANTLNAFDVGDVRTTEAVVYALDRASYQDKVGALCARDYKGVGSQYVEEDKLVCYTVDQGGGKSACNVAEGQAPTLTCTHGGEPAVCYPQEIHDFVAENNADAPHQQDLLQTADGVARTLAPGTHAAGSHLTKTIIRVGTKYIVRRLTPMECERLQGYPDGWTDIGEWTDSKGKTKQSSDAARYKALGNSIALPPWKWVLKRLCACYERDATMASLFDGISGFPLLWTQLNGWGSVLWTSEIEEYPIAVCKRHFGDEATGEKGDFYEAIHGRNSKDNV